MAQWVGILVYIYTGLLQLCFRCYGFSIELLPVLLFVCQPDARWASKCYYSCLFCTLEQWLLQSEPGVMAIKEYSAFLKVPALLEPQHQIVWYHIQEGSLTPLQRSSRCILQPQLTGQRDGRVEDNNWKTPTASLPNIRDILEKYSKDLQSILHKAMFRSCSTLQRYPFKVKTPLEVIMIKKFTLMQLWQRR